MKTIGFILSFIIANSAFAAISQPVTELNDPLIRVLGGNQRNGVTAIEQVFTNVTQGLGGQYQTARTISMQDSLPFAQGLGRQISSFNSRSLGVVPSTPGGNVPPAVIVPPVITIPPVSIIPPSVEKPVAPVTPVPEPETLALMAMGVTILLTRQLKKAK